MFLSVHLFHIENQEVLHYVITIPWLVFLFPRMLQNTHLCGKENSADDSGAAATIPYLQG
jgi:hypothetical protein